MDTIFSSVNAMRAGYLAGAITCGTIGATTYLEDREWHADNERLFKIAKGALALSSVLSLFAVGTALASGTSTSMRTGIGQWVVPVVVLHLSAQAIEDLQRPAQERTFDEGPNDIPRLVVAGLAPIVGAWLTNSSLIAPVGTTLLVAGALYTFPQVVDDQNLVSGEAFLSAAAILGYGLFQRVQAGQWLAGGAYALLCGGSVAGWKVSENAAHRNE